VTGSCPDPVRDGVYARKQIYCPSRIVAWSHGSRFQLGRRLVEAGRGGRLLDYGCGDGTFIAMVHDEFAETAGADVEPRQIADCVRRLGHLRGVRFGLTRDLETAPRWDVVTCMEVLEHCLDAERRRVIGHLGRLVAPGGRLVVSVPIEVGPAVIAKQSMRAIAGLRRLGDYQHRERYSPLELLRSAAGFHIPRVVLQGEGVDGSYAYYGHKGFDYRVVEAELAAVARIDRRVFTPMRWLGPVLNSQVWFVCSPTRDG
jgi:SAM-dependent methyltransferase